MGNHCIAVRNDTTTFRRKGLNVWNFKASLEALDAFDQEITPSPDLLFLTVMQPDLHGLQVVRLLRSRSALDGTLALMLTQLHRLLDCLLYGSARAVMGLTKSYKDAPIHEALMLIGRGEARTQTPCLLPARSCANAGVSSILSGVPASPRRSVEARQFPFLLTARRTPANVWKRWYQTPVSETQRWYQTPFHSNQEFLGREEESAATIAHHFEGDSQRAASREASLVKGFVDSYRF